MNAPEELGEYNVNTNGDIFDKLIKIQHTLVIPWGARTQ